MDKPVKGSKNSNTTGDDDKIIWCPQCKSLNFEYVENGIIGLWY